MSWIKGALRPGTVLENGKYVIGDFIGQGGFGITYCARHTRLGLVAIKEFFPDSMAIRKGETVALSDNDSKTEREYEEHLNRFTREGQILHELNHPNVIRVHDLFRANGTAYLVMDFIRGKTLKQYLNQHPNKILPSGEIEQIVGQLVSALFETHQSSICHLDISPDNVILDKKNKAILIDFGACRLISRVTKYYTCKIEYAPPEILKSSLEKTGPESDIFELSVMIYEMLTGRLPPDVLKRQDTNKLWTPDDVPEEWRKLLKSGLHLRKDERPTNIKAWWESRKKEFEIGSLVIADKRKLSIGQLVQTPSTNANFKKIN